MEYVDEAETEEQTDVLMLKGAGNELTLPNRVFDAAEPCLVAAALAPRQVVDPIIEEFTTELPQESKAQCDWTGIFGEEDGVNQAMVVLTMMDATMFVEEADGQEFVWLRVDHGGEEAWRARVKFADGSGRAWQCARDERAQVYAKGQQEKEDKEDDAEADADDVAGPGLPGASDAESQPAPAAQRRSSRRRYVRAEGNEDRDSEITRRDKPPSESRQVRMAAAAAVYEVKSGKTGHAMRSVKETTRRAKAKRGLVETIPEKKARLADEAFLTEEEEGAEEAEAEEGAEEEQEEEEEEDYEVLCVVGEDEPRLTYYDDGRHPEYTVLVRYKGFGPEHDQRIPVGNLNMNERGRIPLLDEHDAGRLQRRVEGTEHMAEFDKSLVNVAVRIVSGVRGGTNSHRGGRKPGAGKKTTGLQSVKKGGGFAGGSGAFVGSRRKLEVTMSEQQWKVFSLCGDIKFAVRVSKNEFKLYCLADLTKMCFHHIPMHCRKDMNGHSTDKLPGGPQRSWCAGAGALLGPEDGERERVLLVWRADHKHDVAAAGAAAAASASEAAAARAASMDMDVCGEGSRFDKCPDCGETVPKVRASTVWLPACLVACSLTDRLCTRTNSSRAGVPALLRRLLPCRSRQRCCCLVAVPLCGCRR